MNQNRIRLREEQSVRVMSPKDDYQLKLVVLEVIGVHEALCDPENSCVDPEFLGDDFASGVGHFS